MRLSVRTLVAPILVVWSALACGGDTTAPRSTTPLVPLNVGTTFSYHSTDTLIGAPLIGDHAAPDSDFTVRVLRDTTDQRGTHWAVFDFPDRMFGPVGQPSYYANASDGLRRLAVGIGSNGQSFALTYLVFLYPAARGQIMQFGPVISAIDTVITVPAGTFHCLRYDLVDQPTPGPVIYWSVFLAPGTGVVERIVSVTWFIDGQFRLLGRRDRVYRLTAISKT